MEIMTGNIENTRNVEVLDSPDISVKSNCAESDSTGKEKIGWVSPKYTISRSVQLSPAAITSNKCVGFFQDSPEVEHYRLLRTQILQRARKKGGNTVMVTSSVPGEGKTLTSINLSFSFAQDVKKTLQLLPKEKIIGLVLNRQNFKADPYGLYFTKK